MNIAAPSALLQQLPVAVIGAGPVGLAAAAHLLEHGVQPLVFEAGAGPAAAVRAWGHVRLLSCWQDIVDDAAVRLLEAAGWDAPDPADRPTGAQFADRYLAPLARMSPVAAALLVDSRVIAVTRLGVDRAQSAGREDQPFLIRVRGRDGAVREQLAAAVIDASGTWHTPNPAGDSGLPAPGEAEARQRGLLVGPLPDVLGAERERFAGRRVLVTGSGPSAAETLIALSELAEETGGSTVWAVRGTGRGTFFDGDDAAQVPLSGRAELGLRLKSRLASGHVELHGGFTLTGLKSADKLLVTGRTAAGIERLEVDMLVPATGFRPELSWLRELRLDLDPLIEAPRRLGPLIGPESHGCNTLPRHAVRELGHPERDFWIVGAKSYGRAPTFLLADGYEQVRSVAAELAGDPGRGAAAGKTSPTRILVVEDHAIVRLGLATVLDAQLDLDVVGESTQEQETLEAVNRLQPDLVILPLRLGGELRGIELCREIKNREIAPRVLIYTSYNSPADASASYFSGADSFLHKGEQASRLLDAVRGTAAGRRVWIVGTEAGRQHEQFKRQVDDSLLTSREREILGFMLQRLTNAEIANELYIEVPTVKTHVSSILQKLGLRSRRDLF